MKISGEFIGTNLAQLRRARGLTQQELADSADVSLSTVTKLEAGDINRPSIQTLLQIVKVLDYDLDEFLSGKPLPKKLPKASQPKARPSRKLKFVYFDIGGVLVHTESRLLQELSLVYDKPIDQIRSVYYRFIPLAVLGKLSMDDLQMLFLLKLNVKYQYSKKSKFFKHWVDYMEPIEPTHEFAKEVANNYPVGLLTNAVEGFVEQMKKRQLLPSLSYSAIIDSSVVGVDKPNTEIYKIATEKAGVKPSEILFIDDRKQNTESAGEYGWSAEWFDEMQPEESIDRIRKKYFN